MISLFGHNNLPSSFRSPGTRRIIGRLARLLTLAAGALLVAGALRPWLFVPVGGLRLPVYSIFGWGGLVGPAGFLLLVRPRASPTLLLVIAAGSAYLAHTLPGQWLARAQATTGTVDSWFEPLNQLLDQFHIAGFHLTDWSLPPERSLGPGIALTYWGADLAAAAAVFTLLTGPRLGTSRSCPECAAPLARGRLLRFCPACGGCLSPIPACPACRASSEPGDRFCGQCGSELSSGIR